MTYPADFEKKLGFDQIREKLNSYCLCSLGQKEVVALSFRNTFDSLLPDLEASQEMVNLLQSGDTFSFNNFFDPTELYQVIAWEGSFLEEDIFRNIILSLQTIFEAQKFLKNKERYPRLAALAEPVTLPRSVLNSLESKFDDLGKVRDNASPELQRIRKRLLEEQGRVRRVAEAIFRSALEQGWVPEGMSPSIRDGRLVIPMLAAHKRRIRGHVMDESATGQTIFIEPADVMEANNELRDLQLAERREVVKILKELTDLLRSKLNEIKAAYHFLAQLDLHRAKAKLAVELEATLPELTEEPALKWVEARHPLLFLSLRGKRPVVPLNMELSKQDHFLLVSGPNAGGKSVCLKTVGLLQYMLQCGLLVPMQPHSKVGIFQQIFLDIGDQQSIENDLSTYSSHLTNMAWFLRHGNGRTLVLMDELGSGTDPNFGGGIAQAILAELVVKGVWGVATTHYYNLKLFAENTPGVLNGAMLFNTKRLEPLFILETGKPGSSFALEIARKIGLPAQTVASAEAIIGKDLTGLEALMKSVAEEKINNTRRNAELQKKEQQLAGQLQRYQALTEELETRKKEIIEKAKTEAARLLKDTNREIEKTIRHIRENKAERKETKKVREGLKGLTEKVKLEMPQHVDKSTPLREGDKVRLRGQEVTGTIVQLKGKTAIVLFGSVRSQLKVDQLVRSDQAEAVVSSRPVRSLGVDLIKRQAHFETTLDVRGKRAEEIVPLLSQFLDDAVLLGHGELKVLHGKGEGVLRKVVRDHLKKTKAVASFADEHVERGGDGITIVVLK